MKKIFVNGEYDYDYSEEIIDGNVVHILSTSNAEHWSEHYKGVDLLSITDNGDGFVFNHGKLKKKMDYDYAFYLSILLKIISFNDYKIEISDKIELL
jgi:hypothetical protein